MYFEILCFNSDIQIEVEPRAKTLKLWVGGNPPCNLLSSIFEPQLISFFRARNGIGCCGSRGKIGWGGTSGWTPQHSLPHPSSPPTPQPKSENALNREKHSTACLAQICATFVSAKFKPLSLQCFHSCQQRRRPLAAAKLWIEPRRGRGRERTTKKEGSKTAEI